MALEEKTVSNSFVIGDNEYNFHVMIKHDELRKIVVIDEVLPVMCRNENVLHARQVALPFIIGRIVKHHRDCVISAKLDVKINDVEATFISDCYLMAGFELKSSVISPDRTRVVYRYKRVPKQKEALP